MDSCRSCSHPVVGFCQHVNVPCSSINGTEFFISSATVCFWTTALLQKISSLTTVLRFHVLTAASMKMTASRHIAPCCLVEVDRHFRYPSSGRLVAPMMEAVWTSETSVHFNKTTRRYIPGSCNLPVWRTLFWSVAPCSLADTERRPDNVHSKGLWNVGNSCYNTRRNISQDSNFQLCSSLHHCVLGA
jgi:hypothetical protein